MAREVAIALDAPLDIVVTRKIAAPADAEYAIGAVDQEGELVTRASEVGRLKVSQDYLRGEAERQHEEVLDRVRRYRGGRPYAALEGRTVVIVDDGIATGFTMGAAVRFVKRKGPSSLVVAVPVASRESVVRLSSEVDRVVCLRMPEPFYSVGQFYEEFGQVGEEEVRAVLDEAWSGNQEVSRTKEKPSSNDLD